MKFVLAPPSSTTEDKLDDITDESRMITLTSVVFGTDRWTRHGASMTDCCQTVSDSDDAREGEKAMAQEELDAATVMLHPSRRMSLFPHASEVPYMTAYVKLSEQLTIVTFNASPIDPYMYSALIPALVTF